MPKANEIKKGMVLDIKGIPHLVKDLEAKSPSSRGAATLYKIRFTNLQTGQKLDEAFKGDDVVKVADYQKIAVQFSYRDEDNVVFMSMEDYSQFEMKAEDAEYELGFITEGQEGIVGLIHDGKLLTIELPHSVNLQVTDTPPAIKGATASGRTKTALLNTGIEIQVPEYLEPGEIVKVNTETGKFMSRA
jgi:elongation factor P